MALSARTFYLIAQVNSAARDRIERLLRDFDLTARQYTVMSRIRGHEVLSSASLARYHHVTPQAMNEMINNLEGRGFLSRKEGNGDRRQLLVSLTKAGTDLLDACEAKVDSIEPEFFASLNTAEHATLRRLLDVLIEDIRKGEARKNEDV